MTLAIAVLKAEGRAEEEEEDGGSGKGCEVSAYDSIVAAYKQLWGVVSSLAIPGASSRLMYSVGERKYVSALAHK